MDRLSVDRLLAETVNCGVVDAVDNAGRILDDHSRFEIRREVNAHFTATARRCKLSCRILIIGYYKTSRRFAQCRRGFTLMIYGAGRRE